MQALVRPRRIDFAVEMKRRNPYFGCRKTAEQISNAFGIELNKDVVRASSSAGIDPDLAAAVDCPGSQ